MRQCLVEAITILGVELSVVPDSDGADLEKMKQEGLTRLMRPQVAQDERVRLNKGNELLLFFEDLFKVLVVVFGVLLLLKFLDDFDLRHIYEFFKILPKLIFTHES